MSEWKRTAADKVAARDALIPVEWKVPKTDSLNVIDFPRTCGLLNRSELEITETDAVSLVKMMLNGSLKSREVTEAFCKRAAIAQQLVSLPCHRVIPSPLLCYTSHSSLLVFVLKWHRRIA